MIRSKKTLGIINIAGGNIKSLFNSINRKYVSIYEVDDISKNINLDIIIFPGVGNILRLSSEILSKKNSFILDHINNEKKIIGICMGLQILAGYSTETEPNAMGLSLIDGYTSELKSASSHIGWNTLNFNPNSIFSNFDKMDVYFNHKYRLFSSNPSFISGTTHINEHETIPSVIEKNNLIGFQFHPEKSQEQGKKLLNYSILY